MKKIFKMNLLVVSVVEGIHANTDARPNTARFWVDPEAITVFPNLANFHLDVPRQWRWQRNLFSARSIITWFLLDALFKLIYQGVFTGTRWLALIFFLQVGSNVLHSIWIHGHLAEFEVW